MSQKNKIKYINNICKEIRTFWKVVSQIKGINTYVHITLELFINTVLFSGFVLGNPVIKRDGKEEQKVNWVIGIRSVIKCSEVK